MVRPAGSRRREAAYRVRCGSSSTRSVSPLSTTRPFFITIMRCDSSRATARSWVTTTAERPRSPTSAAQEVEQPRLYRYIEAAGRLVHEHQARPGDEIAGDLQALTHAAREGARLVVDAIGFDLDPPEPVDRSGADAAVMPVADRHQPLADIGAGRDAHAQAIGRVLVDEAPVGAHQEAAAPPRSSGRAPATSRRGAGNTPRRSSAAAAPTRNRAASSCRSPTRRPPQAPRPATGRTKLRRSRCARHRISTGRGR